jgi:hypothetical protein
MARRIFDWRPMTTSSKSTLSSISQNEFTRQRFESTLRWMRPPEMMHPIETRLSVAVPARAAASSRNTNFAGGSWLIPVRIGHRRL